METIDGVPVTDEMIQAWADEAERGYDVEVLRAHGRRLTRHVCPIRPVRLTVSGGDPATGGPAPQKGG